MKKLFTGAGFLTEEGKIYLSKFSQEIDNIFSGTEFPEESDIRTMGCMLSKMIGDKVLENLVSLNEKARLRNYLSTLSDDEFTEYLKIKNGPNWNHVSLTEEESDRYDSIVKKITGEVMEQIKKDREDNKATSWFRFPGRGRF